MDNAALLSPADISVIRRYVQTKYAPLPGGRRAEIVADAIRRTLEQRLPDVPSHLKSRMAEQLIRRCVLAEQREVTPDDVLDVCADMDLPDAASQLLLIEPMMQWMHERTAGKWNPDQLTSRLTRAKVIPFPLPMSDLEPATTVSPAVSAEVSIISDSKAQAEPLPSTAPWGLRRFSRAALATAALVVAGVLFAGVWFLQPSSKPKNTASAPPPIAAPQPTPDIGMPPQLTYKEIDKAAVKAYLMKRGALLAEEPYFGAIIESAHHHDVNPLLLFAIVGQEEGFVPKSNKNARQIANNPFNVYHSWQEYNTDIDDSADIAARTIARRGKSRPEGHEPFEWFNKTYAEDPKWSDGVKQIYDKLNRLSDAK